MLSENLLILSEGLSPELAPVRVLFSELEEFAKLYEETITNNDVPPFSQLFEVNGNIPCFTCMSFFADFYAFMIEHDYGDILLAEQLVCRYNGSRMRKCICGQKIFAKTFDKCAEEMKDIYRIIPPVYY